MVNQYLGVHDDSDDDITPSPSPLRRGKSKFLSIKKFKDQVKNVMKKNK